MLDYLYLQHSCKILYLKHLFGKMSVKPKGLLGDKKSTLFAPKQNYAAGDSSEPRHIISKNVAF